MAVTYAKLTNSAPRKQRSHLCHCAERKCSQAKLAPHLTIFALGLYMNSTCKAWSKQMRKKMKEAYHAWNILDKTWNTSWNTCDFFIFLRQWVGPPGSPQTDCSSDRSLTRSVRSYAQEAQTPGISWVSN